MVRIGSKAPRLSSRRFAVLVAAASVATVLVSTLIWLYAVAASRFASDLGIRGAAVDEATIARAGVPDSSSAELRRVDGGINGGVGRAGENGEGKVMEDALPIPRSVLHPGCLAPSDLSDAELRPSAGLRHMVDPPVDTVAAPPVLVCCSTTKGPLSIVAHPSWAPLGAGRFIDMVRSGTYFSSQVALFRCLKGFLCQFGIAGDPEIGRPYRATLKDDPNWLPEGEEHHINDKGVKRFAKGYLAYAGSGPHSRNLQFILSLDDNGRLAGGSPWEVPWGEVVGESSFKTMEKFFTGYGDKGPSQGMLMREGISDGVRQKFPNMDYITGCEVVEALRPG